MAKKESYNEYMKRVRGEQSTLDNFNIPKIKKLCLRCSLKLREDEYLDDEGNVRRVK